MAQQPVDILHTALGPMQVVRVGHEDLDAVLAVMQDAATWLWSRGIRNWLFLLSKEGRAVVARRMHEENYLLLKDGVPVGALYILWQDTLVWGKRGQDGKAGYIHGFAVKREVAGHGVGRDLLEWSARLIASRGRPFIRLDTDADNPGICAYYERLGFIRKGARQFTSGLHQLYERRAVAQVEPSQISR